MLVILNGFPLWSFVHKPTVVTKQDGDRILPNLLHGLSLGPEGIHIYVKELGFDLHINREVVGNPEPGFNQSVV